MNIRTRNRTWSDSPAPMTSRDGYAISRVSVRVARGKSQGRFEAHENSTLLLRRMDTIGKDGANIKALSIHGNKVPGPLVGALNLYLKASKGLQSFRREVRHGSTKSVLVSLLSRVGINYHSYVPEPTNKVPADRGDPIGIGSAS